MKRAALRASLYTGLPALTRAFTKRRLLVLCYHGVVPDDHSRYRFRYENTVSEQEFGSHLEILQRHFRPVSAGDILGWMRNGRSLPPNAALVTFDDGYRNNLTVAAPVLRRYGVPAIFHVSTGYIGTPRMLWLDEVLTRILQCDAPAVPAPEGGVAETLPPRGPLRDAFAKQISRRCKQIDFEDARQYLERLRQLDPRNVIAAAENADLFPFLSWDEVRTLSGQGFEIGSHTVEHPMLTRISQDVLVRELLESKARIEQETGRECRCLAYPNGTHADVSGDVANAAAASGYKLAFTMWPGYSGRNANPLAIARMPVPGHVPLEVFESNIGGVHAVSAALREAAFS